MNTQEQAAFDLMREALELCTAALMRAIAISDEELTTSSDVSQRQQALAAALAAAKEVREQGEACKPSDNA